MKDTVTISDKRCLMVFPGMIASINHLCELFAVEKNSHNTMGVLSTLVYACGHTIELLLKYKIGNEGREIPKKHDLFKLFNLLSDQEKENIKSSFRKLKAKYKIPPTGPKTEQAERELQKLVTEKFGMPTNYNVIKWNNIEGILELAKECHVDWRYSVEKGKGLLIQPQALALAVRSIYNTIGEI